MTVVLCGALTATACTGGAEPDSSGTFAAATVSSTDSHVLDPSVISGLATQVEIDNDKHIYVAWPFVPGADALEQALGGYIGGRQNEFENDYPDGVGDASPELNLNWDLVGASKDAVGVQMTGYEFAGGGGADSSKTFWYEPSNNDVVSNIELINSSSREAFKKAVREKALAAGADAQLLDPVLNANDIPRMAFTSAGDLIVGFDEYQVAAGSQGAVAVGIAAKDAASILSDFGKAAQRATLTPSDPAMSEGSEHDPNAATDAPSSSAPEDSGATNSPAPSASDEPAPSQSSAAPAPSNSSGAPAKPKPSTKPSTKPSAPKASSAPAPLPPKPGKTVNCRVLKCVAITYDDGPARYTKQLLDTLKAKNAVATFYVVGSSVRAQPALMRRMVNEGNEVGNHTWAHPQLTTRSAGAIASELKRTNDAILKATGVAPRTMRPPYGSTNSTVAAASRSAGLAQILWTVDTEDWKNRNVGTTTRRAVGPATRNSIILLHDIHQSSVKATPGIIDGLRAKGFTLVTVSQLLGNPTPGKTYTRG